MYKYITFINKVDNYTMYINTEEEEVGLLIVLNFYIILFKFIFFIF